MNNPGASVSDSEAKQIAIEKYGLDRIETIELRLLSESERELLTEEQKRLTPVYYVIKGQRDAHPILVYVSSNNIEHHFTARDNGKEN